MSEQGAAQSAETARLRAEVEHWKAHAEEAGEGFARVCKDYARVSARNVALLDRLEAAEAKVARVEAAIRLVQPDHLTPLGARQLRAALGAGSTGGRCDDAGTGEGA